MRTRLLEYITNRPLMIEPSKGEAIFQLIENWSAGQPQSERPEYEAAEPRAQERVSGGKISVIPITGVIAHRARMVQSTSARAGASTELVGEWFDAAMADSSVGAVVFDIDSPGGDVFGTPELAAKIYNARGKKPIVAVANAYAGSAAFYLGSAAEEFVVTPSGEVGSLGVIVRHMDVSKQAEEKGVRVTHVYAGKHKSEGNPFEALSEDAQGYIQQRVNAYYDAFVSDVATYRSLAAEYVEQNFGQGRMVSAQDALARGMVDKVQTLETTLLELAGKIGESDEFQAKGRPLFHAEYDYLKTTTKGRK